MSHRLQTDTFLPIPRPRVFEFFSNPGNLARITPPAVRFRMVSRPPIVMQRGTELEYRIRAMGLPMRCASLIEQWDPPRLFVDVQLRGPYQRWIHTHRFVEQRGGTLVEDDVEYALPAWPIGELLHPLVKRQLDRIFAFRRAAIERLLR